MKSGLMITIAVLLVGILSVSCFETAPTELPRVVPVGCLMATSAAPAWGPNLINAARMAVNEVNSSGGIGGRMIELVIEDEGPTSSTSLMALHRLIEDKKVQIIIGCTTSQAAMLAGPYAESKKVPIVSPSATSGELSRQGWSKWVFRVSPEDTLQGGVVAKLIKDRGLKRVAVLCQDTVYGRGVAESAMAYLKGLVEISANIRYDPAKLSYMAELNTIRDKKPDCVLHVGYPSDGVVVYRQAGELGLDGIPWFAVDGVYDMSLDKYIDAAKFMEKAVTGTVAVPDLQSEAYKSFKTNYKVTYQIDPTVYCDTTYDGVRLIVEALKATGVYHGTSLREALSAAGKDFKGVSGVITFDQSGTRIAGNYGIWKVKQEGTQYKFVLTGETVSFLKGK